MRPDSSNFLETDFLQPLSALQAPAKHRGAKGREGEGADVSPHYLTGLLADVRAPTQRETQAGASEAGGGAC